MLERIVTDEAAPPGGHYSQAVVAGEFVFVSGQLPVNADGEPDVAASFEEQAKRALANLLAIVRAAGCSTEQVAKVTVYLVGVEHWPAFDLAFAQAFGEARPARAIVPVPALHHGYLVEIDAVALR